MKIAVAGTRGFPGVQGGVERHCEQLYTHLAELGCDITVFSRMPYVDAQMLLYKGVSLIPLDCPRNKFLEAITHTYKSVLMARKLRPDIFHIHGIGPSVVAPLACLFGLKVVVTVHSQNYKHLKWGFFSRLFLRLCEAISVKFAKRLIAVSELLSDDIEKKYHKHVVYIPNGVLITQPSSSEDILMELGVEKRKYILSVGRFVPEKGFNDLIDAFNAGNFGEWKLVIAGGADHENKFSMDLKAKAGKSNKIFLPGQLSDKPLRELYSHAGLFVLPSYYEGLPIVLLEAMSYGLSCIASDIPANKNIELRKERFFKVGNVQALSAKISEYIDKPFSKEERERQIHMITEKYNWEKIAKNTLREYQSVTLSNCHAVPDKMNS